MVTGYEIGLRLGEFWEMPPAEFERMVAGYLRRTNKQAVYFREIYALLFNINRGEKTPAITGQDVMRLAGEKLPRQPRVKKRTQAELNDLVNRINQAK